jgi:hypothetical protein
LDIPTIVREKNPGMWDVLTPVIMGIVASFFMSVPVGVFATVAAGMAIVASIAHNKPSVEDRRPVVLEIDDRRLVIQKRWVREIEIPWQDVEAMQFSRGRKGAVYLDIRVTEPERYLGRLMRVNLALSRYHISVRVSGLELSPKEIALVVEHAQALFLKNLRSQKATR